MWYILAMEKVGYYDPDRWEEYLSATWINGPESAEICANIRNCIIEVAKLRPEYE